MKNFECYIGVDWSGAKGIYSPSVSVASIQCDQLDLVLVENQHHRYWSRADVFEWICDLVQNGERSLIGIDCNFGYCQSVGARQFSDEYTAHDLWRRVDECSPDDNFYAGGFWEHSDYADNFWTEGKMPKWFDAEALRRQTETTCIQSGYGKPESPFKLIGAAQVGKGGLAGMRVAHALKQKCGDRVAIWPFERDIADEATVVITEIFPRQFLKRFEFGHKKVRSQEDFEVLLKHPAIDGTAALCLKPEQTMSDHDTDALISAVGLKYLCGGGEVIPHSVSNPPAMQDHHARCEGWIFGVGDTV